MHAVSRGEFITSPAVAARIAEFFESAGRTGRPPEAFPVLTAREREVLDLIAQGRNNAHLARHLGLSPKTIRNHISNIFAKKLHVADRAEAIVRAREAGLGRTPGPGGDRDDRRCGADPADLHLHQFADLAFGGRVLWGTAGGDMEESLRTCRSVHGPHGLFDLPGNIARIVLRTRGVSSLLGHCTGGSPGFEGWPQWSDVTHQGVHRACLKRAVDGGLRLVVMMTVNSELLGRLSGASRYADMEAVDLQLQAAKNLETEIDAEAGGPGRGWYRIVYTPDEARRIISSGRLRWFSVSRWTACSALSARAAPPTSLTPRWRSTTPAESAMRLPIDPHPGQRVRRRRVRAAAALVAAGRPAVAGQPAAIVAGVPDGHRPPPRRGPRLPRRARQPARTDAAR